MASPRLVYSRSVLLELRYLAPKVRRAVKRVVWFHGIPRREPPFPLWPVPQYHDSDLCSPSASQLLAKSTIYPSPSRINCAFSSPPPSSPKLSSHFSPDGSVHSDLGATDASCLLTHPRDDMTFAIPVHISRRHGNGFPSPTVRFPSPAVGFPCLHNRECASNRHVPRSHSSHQHNSHSTRCDDNLIEIPITKVDTRLPVCITANVRSIVQKVDEMEAVIRIYNPSLICLCETWLMEDIPDEVVQLDNYTMYRKDRLHRIGGGVATYVNNSQYTCLKLEQFHNEDIESLWLLLKQNQRSHRNFSSLVVINVYHPPSENDADLEQHLMYGLDVLLKKYSSLGIIITGDFSHCRFKYIKSAYHLKQIVQSPTRQNTILDLFFTNMHESYKVEILPPLASSDHNMVLSSPIFGKNSIEIEYRWVRSQTNRNKGSLLTLLENQNWSQVYYANSSELKSNIFYDTLYKMMDECLPWRQVPIPVNSKPWVTPHFIELVHIRDFYWSCNDKVMYKHYKNKVDSLRKTLRKQFVENNMERMKNPRKWWSGLKGVLGKNKSVTCPLKPLATMVCGDDLNLFTNLVNDQLISVASDIKPLNTSEFPEFQHAYTPDEFLPSSLEICDLLSAININKTGGPDGIPNWIWKDGSEWIAGPITSIICSSMREGAWPTLWRCADISPIAKTKHPDSIETDIRLIASTCVVSKAVCENIMIKHIWHFIKYKVDSRQFGARKGCSSVDALLLLIDTLISGSDEGKISRLVAIDFHKAFERIDHIILLRKLLSLDVPTWLCRWVSGFLTSRYQRVKYRGSYSSWQQITTGVPQGTKFGPVGFIVLVNELIADVKYMDDCTIMETINCVQESRINSKLHLINDWAIEHKMKLNPTKTQEMRISFNKSEPEWEALSVNGDQITAASSIKLLGVTISNNLTWNKHVEDLVKKANKRIYFLVQMKRARFSQIDLVHFYCASIRSLLEYAAPVWHYGLSKKCSDLLEGVQKRALKMICGIRYQDHSYNYENILEVCKLQKLRDRRELLCRKAMLNLSSDLKQKIPQKSEYSRRLRRTTTTIRTRTERYRRSFLPSAVKFL